MTATVHYMPEIPQWMFRLRIDAQLSDADEEYAAGQFATADALVEKARAEHQQRRTA